MTAKATFYCQKCTYIWLLAEYSRITLAINCIIRAMATGLYFVLISILPAIQYCGGGCTFWLSLMILFIVIIFYY